MNQEKTSLGRLLTGMCLGQFGLTIMTIVPIALLLVFKFIELDPQNVTADFSIVTGIGAVINILMAYVGGAVSDRTTFLFGRRRTWIMIGTICAAASLMGVATAKSITVVIVFWCITLFFSNFATASYSALIPDQIDESKRGTASGIIGVFNPLSILVGFTIMTAINSYSLIMKFGILSIISVVGAFLACTLIKDPPISEYKSAHRVNKLSFGERVSKIYPSPRKYPYFTWALLTRFFIAVAFSASSYGTIYLMQKFGIAQESVTGISTIATYLSMGGLMISSIFGGMLSDKFRKQKPFVAGSAIICAIGVWMFAFAPSLTFYYIGNAVLGLGFGAFLAVDIALVARFLPNKEDAAKDFGIMNVAGNIPGSLVPVVATPLIAAGGFTLFYGILGVAALLSAAAVAPVPEMSPNSVEEELATQ